MEVVTIKVLSARPVDAVRRDAQAAWLRLCGGLLVLAPLACCLPGPGIVVATLSGRPDVRVAGGGVGIGGAAQDAVLVVAAMLTWLLLLWAVIVLALAVAGRTSGALGRLSRCLLGRLAPHGVRQILVTAVGASLVAGLAACGSGSAPGSTPVTSHAPPTGVGPTLTAVTPVAHRSSGSSPPGSSPPGSSPGGSLHLDWPATAMAEPAASSPAEPVNLDWPAGAPPARASSAASPSSTHPTAHHASSAQHQATTVHQSITVRGEPVVVLRGDSLWSIAARHLGPAASAADIDQAWHQWYAANASVIGSDPDVILPGQILLPPEPRNGCPTMTSAALSPDGERSRARGGARPPRPYLTSVPDCEPPFDDERPARRRIQGLTAVRPAPVAPSPARRPVPIPTGASAVATPDSVTATVPPWSQDPDMGVRRTTTADLPPARRSGPVLARAFVEVLSGQRPVAQLRIHCAPDVFAGLQDRPIAAGSLGPPVERAGLRARRRRRRGQRGVPPW